MTIFNVQQEPAETKAYKWLRTEITALSWGEEAFLRK